MNLKTPSMIALTCLALAACSPMPDAIAPVSAAGAYDGLTCAQAQTQLNAVSAELASESAHQTQAAAMDAVGVFLVLVPVSQLTGQNHAGAIGTLKGQQDALQQRLLTCQG